MPYKTLLTSFHAGITGRIAAVVAVVAGNPGNMAANDLLNKTQAGLKYILNACKKCFCVFKSVSKALY